jgi:hypothetical protein
MKVPEALGKFLILMASTCVTLLVAECGSRIFYQPPAKAMSFAGQSYYEKHDVVGWLPRKNIKGVHNRTGSFATTFRTNSNGLRDREYSFDKPNGVTRIVVLGDSSTWGWGVGDDEIYTEVLESLLPNVEVINLGVSAYGTQQEFDYLKMQGMKYDPDMVILGFSLNDIAGNGRGKDGSTNSKSESDREISHHSSFFLKLKEFLAYRSAFYDFMTEQINMNKYLVNFMMKLKIKEGPDGYEALDTNLSPALISYPPSLDDLFDKTKSKLLEMKSFLEARNIRFIVVLIPTLETIDRKMLESSLVQSVFEPNDFDLEKPYKLLEQFGKESHIEIVNPFSSLNKAHADGSSVLLRRDLHLNKRGHDVLAREICKYLTTSPQPFAPSPAC